MQPKQIGWSNESNLLWEILDKLNRLNQVIGNINNTNYVPDISLATDDYNITLPGLYEIVTVGSGYLIFPDPVGFEGKSITILSKESGFNLNGSYIPQNTGGTPFSSLNKETYIFYSCSGKWIGGYLNS